jgi:hypothetical protein
MYTALRRGIHPPSCADLSAEGEMLPLTHTSDAKGASVPTLCRPGAPDAWPLLRRAAAPARRDAA